MTLSKPRSFGISAARALLQRIPKDVGRGLILGFVARGLQSGMALLVLPFVLRKLSASEVGIWYVFMTVQGLTALADFGFQFTFTRNFSMAYSGVTEFRRVGLGETQQGEPNMALAVGLFKAARVFYAGVSLVVLLVLLTGGSLYIYDLAVRSHMEVSQVELAWTLFAIGAAVDFYFQWLSPVLLGSGAASVTYLFQILDRVLYGALAIMMLLLDGRLLSLAIAFVAATIASRLLIQPLVAPYLPKAPERSETKYGTVEILRIVWHNASRMGLVALGFFLVTRSNFLVLSIFSDLGEAARYGVTFQLLYALYSVGQLPGQVFTPRLVGARVRGDRATMRRIYVGFTGLFIGLFASGSLVLAFAGEPLLQLIHSHVQLLSTPLVLLLALVLLLEGIHAIAGTVISTENRIPFVVPFLVAGAVIVVLSTIVEWQGFGVLGIIAVQGLVELSYNNWKWPMVVIRDLWGTDPDSLARGGWSATTPPSR